MLLSTLGHERIEILRHIRSFIKDASLKKKNNKKKQAIYYFEKKSEKKKKKKERDQFMTIFYSIMTCVAARCIKHQKLSGFIMDVITSTRATTGWYGGGGMARGGGMPQLATCRYNLSQMPTFCHVTVNVLLRA